MSKIKICQTPELLAEDAAKKVIGSIENNVSIKGEADIALSGGNTPKLLFEMLLKNHKDELEKLKINFYWCDERCVPSESKESNFGEAYRLLFSKINLSGYIYRMKGEKNPPDEAERYSSMMKNNLKSKNEFPEIDLILLGMGDDGHTASIFPGQLQLMNSDKVCVNSVNPYSGQNRLTLTGKVLNNSAEIIFMVTGKNKSKIVKDVFEDSDSSKEYPVSFIRKDDSVIWYMDESAASLI